MRNRLLYRDGLHWTQNGTAARRITGHEHPTWSDIGPINQTREACRIARIAMPYSRQRPKSRRPEPWSNPSCDASALLERGGEARGEAIPCVCHLAYMSSTKPVCQQRSPRCASPEPSSNVVAGRSEYQKLQSSVGQKSKVPSCSG